jgi:hypothetical protein
MNPTKNTPQLNGKKYCFTGKLRVGKDYAAETCEGSILGFADPFYTIVETLHGKQENKDKVPGLRELYQKIGQWGRGVVNDKYPLTAERAAFTLMMRIHGHQLTNHPVQWESYGRNEDIWVHSLLAMSQRLAGEHTLNDMDFDADGKSVLPVVDPAQYPVQFVTNVRFQNELTTLGQSGFEHFHVLCSDATYTERLRSVGIALEDPRLNDLSEQFARNLDVEVANIIRTHETGTKIKVIWNDHRPIPSPRLFTMDEFKNYVDKNEQDTNTRIIEAGNARQEPTETAAPVDKGLSNEDLETAGDEGTVEATGYQD